MIELTLKNIYGSSDDVCRNWLMSARWGDEIKCPKCGADAPYFLTTRRVYKCSRSGCHKQFSVFSGTPLNSSKLSSVDLLGALFVFTSGAVGVSALQMSRLLGVDYKSAFVLCHKFREAIRAEMEQLVLDGTVEIDGGTFGGHRRYFNHGPFPKEGRRNKSRTHVPKMKNRRVIVVAHQRMGRTVVFSGQSESDALDDITATVSDSSTIQADGAHAWDGLNRVYEMMRVHHKYSFSANGACTNNAESYFSQFRRMHRGTHKQMSGELMIAYAAEMAWRLDMRELTHKERVLQLAKTVLNAEKSEKWNGYWQKCRSSAASAEAA